LIDQIYRVRLESVLIAALTNLRTQPGRSSLDPGVGPRRQDAGRLAHPAGTNRLRQGLDAETLKAIAVSLSRSAPRSDLEWTQGTRRRYARILDTPRYDAWLIEWSPASSLELHDHGGSRGEVAVTGGALVETYTDLERRHPLRTRIVESGESFTIPEARVHELTNPGPLDAVSVHVYSPPLREMTFYDHRAASYLNPLYTSEGDLAALEEAAT
jgi:cysteine dioxygenase type I